MPRRLVFASLSVAVSTLCAMPSSARTPPQRPPAGSLEEITVTHNFTLGRPGHFRFTRDGRTLLFLRADGDDARLDLWAKDVATGEERRLLAAEDLLGGRAESLSDAEKARRERQRIKTRGFTHFDVGPDGRVVLELSGDLYLYDIEASESRRVPTPEGVVLDPRLSPDGERLAFVRDHDLYVMAAGGGRPRALTKRGSADRPHGLAEFVAQEEMDRHHGYWWSPDSDRIVYQSNDYRDLERFTIADAAAPEEPARALPYPRPGRANAQVRLHVVGVDGKGRVEIKWDRAAYPYLARVHWAPKAPLAILVQARDQKSQAYLRVNPETGATAVMHAETDDAWLNLTHATRWLSDGKSFLWASERDGAWALARHYPRLRAKKGGLKKSHRVLAPEAGLRSVVHVDEARGWVWFIGGSDPVEAHLYRAPLSGDGAPVQISADGGDHGAVFAKDGAHFVLTRATFTAPPRSAVMAVEGLDAPADVPTEGRVAVRVTGKTPRRLPRIERVPPERAGGFHALIVRPHDFSPDKRYPVVHYVYGGPHHNVVQANVTRYFLQQWIADHGFVVVCLDGRGTQWRGRDFERALGQRFHEVPLEDQVKGLKALGEHYGELDLDRVGIYGWSFGGYLSALAVLRRPDVYKVGVAGAPVTDWRYYDTHYTERYLGVPEGDDDEVYRRASLLDYAPGLERPLMLVHGVADDNVYFAHTLLLADRLFREGKDYAFLPLVRLTHQVADPKVREALYDRMVGYLGAALWTK